MGSSKYNGSERAARFFSSSSGVSVQYLVRRCSNIARGVTLPNPKSGSSSVLRNKAFTADRIWAIKAALKALWRATSASASA